MKHIIPYILYEKVSTKYIAYHGTNNSFEEFDYAYIGKGTDEYGPGFYFTSNYDEALRYGKVNKYELTIDKFIIKNKKPLKNEISKLIRWAPNYRDILTNFDEVEYVAFNKAIEMFTREEVYDKIDSYLSIWSDFYKKRGNSIDYVKNLVKLKYDAYIIEEEDYSTKYVMYNIGRIRKLD